MTINDNCLASVLLETALHKRLGSIASHILQDVEHHACAWNVALWYYCHLFPLSRKHYNIHGFDEETKGRQYDQSSPYVCNY